MGEFIVEKWNEAQDGPLNHENMKKKLTAQVSDLLCNHSHFWILFWNGCFFQLKGYRCIPYTFSAGMHFGEHDHDVDKKDVVMSGQLQFNMYGKSVILNAGETLVVPKGVKHSATVLGNQPVEFFDASKN